MTRGEEAPAQRGGTAQPGRQRAAQVAVVVLALLCQGGVLFLTFAMGLQWDGWTYLVAVLQALGGLVAVLALRKSWLALAVPVISAALSVALLALFIKVEGASACTQDMGDATAQLTPPPGTSVSFNGEPANGCIARFTVPASETDMVVPHYRREVTRHGWEITAEDPESLVATKDGIVINVMAHEFEGGLVVIEVQHTP